MERSGKEGRIWVPTLAREGRCPLEDDGSLSAATLLMPKGRCNASSPGLIVEDGVQELGIVGRQHRLPDCRKR